MIGKKIRAAALSGGRSGRARESVAAVFAAVLALLWLGGALGLQLPEAVNPSVNPAGNAAAQFLLFLPVLFAGRSRLRDGAQALAAMRPNADALLLIASAAAALEGFFAAVLTALTVGRGGLAEASGFASFNFLWIAAVRLAAASFCERRAQTAKRQSAETDAPPRAADRICAVLVPIAVLLAIVVFGIRILLGAGVLLALCHALAAAVICCPTALLTMSPLVYTEAERAGEKFGCIAVIPIAFETIGASDFVALNDISLLTEDKPSLYDLYAVDADKTALLACAAAAAKDAPGQYAAAIVGAANALDLPLKPATDCAASKFGFFATVCGDRFRIGDLKFLRKSGVFLPKWLAETDFGGMKPLYAAAGRRFRGVFLFYRRPLPDAAAALRRLEEVGVLPLLPDEGCAEIRLLAEKLPKNEDALLPSRDEKVLQASKEGDTIRLTADGFAVTLREGTPTALVGAVLLGGQVFRILRALLLCALAAIGVCLPFAAGLFWRLDLAVIPAVCAAVSAVSMLAVLLLLQKLRYFAPPEFSPEEETTQMFGKVNYTIHVEGMSCSHCAAHVKSALESIRGVSARVELEEKTAHVKCPSSLDEKLLTAAITEAGFTVASVERV